MKTGRLYTGNGSGGLGAGSTDFMPGTGKFGGKIASPETLERVAKYLDRHGIDLIPDAPLPPGKAGKFSTLVAGKRPQLWIPPNATEYQLLHELIHARDFIRLGRTGYFQLGGLAREESVFKGLMNSRRLTALERQNAETVIGQYRAESGGTCK